MKDFINQLQLLLRARYPIISLLTHEELRVWRVLKNLAAEERKSIFRWRMSVGLENVTSGGLIPDTTTPADMLNYLSQITTPSLFVCWDMHSHLDDPLVKRCIRDLCLTLGSRQQSLITCGARLVIPDELEKSMAILDVPLPSFSEASKMLTVLCQQQGLEIMPELFERFVHGSLGLTEAEMKRMLARILLGGNGFTEQDLSLQLSEKRRAIHRSQFLEFWDIQQLNLDVGGLDNLKRWLEERSRAFSSSAREFGLPEPKGLFLLGVQGCGKSLMAKAVAKMWGLPLLRLDVAAVFQDSGVEEGLRETIRIAESLAPVILWIDELEKGFMSDGVSGQSLGYFLTWMQEKKKPVFVVATANEVRALPPELLRKGRFDEIFFVDLPNLHERLEILDIHLKLRNRQAGDFDLTLVVEETERFSGAELEQVVISGLFRAFAESRTLDTNDLLEAAREIIPLAVTMDDRLKDLREWARPRARRASADRRRVDFFSEWGIN